MIPYEVYRLLVAGILAVGVVAGGWYLWLYRAWRIGRWVRNPVARDASGWVALVFLLYSWSLLRLLINWSVQYPARPGEGVSLPAAAAAVILGVGLDGALIHRLISYLAVLKQEREHPTRVCNCCKGMGVVLVGERVTHLDEGELDGGGVLEGGGQPER
jgi:hypothetical protein